MELEHERKITLFHILVLSQNNGTLRHKVCRKPTHIDGHPSGDSNHHPKQNRNMIKTFRNQAIRICGSKHLGDELDRLKTVFEGNECNKKWLNWQVFLPYIYIKNVSDHFETLLQNNHFKTTVKPTKTIRHCLRSAKHPRDTFST